jgi:hypothetical protein
MMDQNTDVTFATLRGIVSSYPQIREYVKTAQVGEHIRESLPTSAFADPGNRMFPVHSAADAVLSKAYATKVANLADSVMHQIDTALDMYGVPKSLFRQEKVAHAEPVEKPIYLAESQQKLAFYSNTPISAGEEALRRNQSKLASKTLTDGALKLVKEASRRGENVSEWTLKYAGLVQCDNLEVRDWVETRALKAPNDELRNAYTKLAHVATSLDGTVDRDDLVKLSNAIGELDAMAGFSKYYGKTMLDPVATVFNTKTAMQPMIEMGGKTVPVEKLLAVSPESYGDILGSDIVEEISSNGELMPDALIEILETLPADMKTSLVKELNL